MNLDSKICGICEKNTASYTCPRCNLTYCSSACYRNLEKHGECSETFYKDQVLSELEMLKIDDIESKNQMATILKNEAKNLAEDDEFYNEDFEKELEITKEDVSEPKEDELVKEYLNEILNWRPWWHNQELKTSFLITELNTQDDFLAGIDQKLVENSTNLSIQNSSPFIYNEILKCFYLYQMCMYVYQLKLDDFKPKKDEKIDLILLEEICNNYLEMEQLLNKRVAKGLNIREEFESIISVLLEEGSYFLKLYINKKFLLNLIDELEYVQPVANIQLKMISHLYELFHLISTSKVEIKKKVDQIGNNCPINVFHVNREKHVDAKPFENGHSRVKIIKADKDDETLKKSEKLDSKFSKRDYKLFMKRSEFYFKWLIVNKTRVSNVEICESIKSDLGVVKQSFVIAMEQFKKEKELIDQNLKHIRPSHKSKLIEEI